MAASCGIEAHGGFINAYSGDGVMAAFAKIDAGNAANAGKPIPPLQLRVGIHSGPVAEAEIGAANRFNFSVVGDVVNLASRLEELGKVLFAGEADIILVGHGTRQSVQVPIWDSLSVDARRSADAIRPNGFTGFSFPKWTTLLANFHHLW